MKQKILLIMLLGILVITGCSRSDMTYKEEEEMYKVQYQFQMETNEEKWSALYGTSYICHIIEGFPSDYIEQTALVYGRLRGLFGEPTYESMNYEDQYAYYITATTEDGKEIFLDVYSGSSGPAIGGQHDEETAEAARQLIQIILQTEPVDYDYVGFYLDGPSKVHQGVKNGVPYAEEEEIDPEDEDYKELIHQMMGEDL